MPFAVFRRHQRKLLAIFAIMAMFAFVLSDWLISLVGGRGGGPRGAASDPVVATLKWKTIHSSDLEPMRLQRQRASYFVGLVQPQFASGLFGGFTTRELVDALILEHEADKLGVPATVDLANRWLRQITGSAYNARFFEDTFRRSSLSEQITDEQLLLDIANQVRILTVRMLPVTADATPLDVFESYREQEERVSAYAVGVKVEDYLAKVPEPTDAEISALFDSAKDRLPDLNGSEPGFKVPHKVRFEAVSADVAAVTDKIRKSLTTDELRTVYKERASEFPPSVGELPSNLFAGAPDLTPHDAFLDVREDVARIVATERAGTQVDGQLEDFKNNVMLPFEERYYDLDSASEEEKPAASREKPKPGNLVKDAAAKAGLTYEATPLVPSTQPDLLGPLGKAHLGFEVTFNPTPFDSAAFAPALKLYTPVEFSDAKFRDEGGRRYLAWKVDDEAARVPALKEVRDDVIRAWKLAKARPMAEAEAKRLAEEAKKAGAGVKIRDVADKRPVITTDPRPKMAPAALMGIESLGGYRLTDIYEIPHAGDALRDAMYGLKPDSAVVAPDATKTVYYVLTLRSRDEAEFDRLYVGGLADTFYNQAGRTNRMQLIEEWTESLREQAGLPANWSPPNERRSEDADAGR